MVLLQLKDPLEPFYKEKGIYSQNFPGFNLIAIRAVESDIIINSFLLLKS